jgi:hypothetical protein
MAPRRLFGGLAAAAAAALFLLPALGQAAGLYKAGSDVVKLTDANFEVRVCGVCGEAGRHIFWKALGVGGVVGSNRLDRWHGVASQSEGRLLVSVALMKRLLPVTYINI